MPGLSDRFVARVLAVCRPLYGAVAISVPLVIVNRLAMLVMPASTKFLVDDVILPHRFDLLWIFLPITAGAALVQGASTWALARYIGRARERLVASLRTRLQAHLLSLPLGFHESSKTGALVSAVMHEVEGFPKLLSAAVIEAGGAALGAVIAFLLLLRVDPLLAFGGLALILTHAGLSQHAIRRVTSLFADHQRTKALVMSRLHESLTGVRLIKAYDAERHENAVFSDGAWRIFHKYAAAMMTTEAMRAASVAVTGVGTAALMYAGATRVLSGELTLGGLMTFSVMLALLMAPINQLAGLATQLPEAIAEVERTMALLAEIPESSGADRPRVIPAIRGRVTFDEVSFGYAPGQLVLRDVSFDIEPGTVTAVVGASGAGKSTLAALVASLYTPSTGAIRVDGIDLSTVAFPSYRSQLGMVLQDTFLFDGTIADNVMFTRTDATEAELVAACRVARVDEFAELLPQGYRSTIGERGVKLSGGQRQRIAIARAILANPRILILDEPTSSLDIHAEDVVIDALMRLIAGRTTFVISHRLSLLHAADRLLMVENGRVVERDVTEGLSGLAARPWRHAAAGAPAVDPIDAVPSAH